jgi:hypothetical protein
LEIERGRYKKPVAVPVNERKCKTCNKLEDEFHFMFECKLYDEIRPTYIKRFYYTMPSIPKTIALLQSENLNDIRRLGKFIHKAFEIRKINENAHQNM